VKRYIFPSYVFFDHFVKGFFLVLVDVSFPNCPEIDLNFLCDSQLIWNMGGWESFFYNPNFRISDFEIRNNNPDAGRW